MKRKSPVEGDYVEAVVFRVMVDIREKKYVRPHHWGAVEALVKAHTRAVLVEIQHRLYQDVLANGMDLARQIDPTQERKR